MNNQLIKNWEEAKRQRQEAEAWNNLPNGRKYMMDDTFDISIAHCHPPKLVRAGQQTCGGTNYWKSEDGLNRAITKFLVDNWEEIYPKVLTILKQEEILALKACQEYVTQMQQLIDTSEPL